MIRAEIAETRVMQSWQDYQAALVRAIAPLTDAQLRQRVIPNQRTPGEIAEHIVFGRALHLYRTLGREASALTPVLTWDDADDPPRSASEIVQGLEQTWRVITATLLRGAPADSLFDQDEVAVVQTLWGLLDHDLPHAGELALLLGAAGLPGVEI